MQTESLSTTLRFLDRRSGRMHGCHFLLTFLSIRRNLHLIIVDTSADALSNKRHISSFSNHVVSPLIGASAFQGAITKDLAQVGDLEQEPILLVGLEVGEIRGQG